jgi:hypothetical protein
VRIYAFVDADAERDDAAVLERIRKVHRDSRGRYGQPRIPAQLACDGGPVNHKRVERLMPLLGSPGVVVASDLVGIIFKLAAQNVLPAFSAIQRSL